MRTFNWFFNLGDDEPGETLEDGKATPPASAPNAIIVPRLDQPVPPQTSPAPAAAGAASTASAGAEHLAVTEQYSKAEIAAALTRVMAAVPKGADSQGTATAEPTREPPAPAPPPDSKSSAVESSTMHAYAPAAVPASLPPSTRAALQGAQSQFHGSVPMTLGKPGKTPTSPLKSERRRPAAWLRKHIQTVLLVAATVLVLGAVGWSFYPSAGGTVRRPATPAQPPGSKAALPAPAAPAREDPAAACLTENTAYRSSAERDQVLRDAIAEFDNGRLERAHARLQEYSEIACDRATVEAIAMLERQLDQKSHER